MPEASFDSIYHRLQQLYATQEYAQALTLSSRAIEEYPEQRTVLDYWRMTMAARTGAVDLALIILAEALDRGEWYSDLLLRRSPSFQPMLDDPRFELLVARNQQIAEQDHAREYPLFTLRPEGRCASGGPPCPLLIGLHAGGTTAHTSLPFWAPGAAAGWLVAAPQSSQAIWKNAYVWNDREFAESDVQKHFATLRQTYSLDLRQIVVAGHAAGGELAIWLALRGSIEMSGFIAIAPGGMFMDDLEEWQSLLEAGIPPGLRGYIIVGKDDASIPHENIHKLTDNLNLSGVECILETIPGLEHEFDPEYTPAIVRALEFLSQS